MTATDRPHRPTCQVPTCGAVVAPGMLVCADDGNDLALELLTLPGLALALEASHAKLMRFGAATVHGGPREDEAPLPYNPRASQARRELTATLALWADVVAKAQGLARPLNTLPALGSWLAGQVRWLRADPLGPEAVVKIRGAIREASRVVDRPADLSYAGPCGNEWQDDQGGRHVCTAELYANPSRPVVRCRECKAEYQLADRRAWLLRRAEEAVLPATELARAIGGLGVEVTPAQVRAWHARGELAHVDTRPSAVGRGPRLVPVYRVGDVLDQVAAVRARRQARAAGAQAEAVSA